MPQLKLVLAQQQIMGMGLIQVCQAQIQCMVIPQQRISILYYMPLNKMHIKYPENDLNLIKNIKLIINFIIIYYNV